MDKHNLEDDDRSSFKTKSSANHSASTFAEDGNNMNRSGDSSIPLSSTAPTLTNSNHNNEHVTISGTVSPRDTTSPGPHTNPQSPTNHQSSNTPDEHEPVIASMRDFQNTRKSSILRDPLPPLPFHLREHRGAVAAISLIMIIDHGLFPPVCYFALSRATHMSHTHIFAIVTAVFGIVLGLEIFVRAIKLVWGKPQYRPLGNDWRWGMDFWQLSFTVFLIANVLCVSIGTALEPPFINLLAMPMPLIIFNLSFLLILFDFLHERKVRTPFRISSTPKGEIWPRFIYVIIEDIVAVDCNGKREWRQAWKDRVAASKPMRETLKRLSMFWSIGGMCTSAICLGLLWGFDSITGKEAGYALGWLLPWAWIIPSTIFTTFYVKHRLKDERHFCQRYRESISV